MISPASWFDPNKVQTGMDSLRALGLQPQLGEHALARYGQYSAGTPEQRLEDLHAAFADDSVKAIICNRGGYGSAEMLSGLDLDLIARNPKIFVACSDISSLETYIHDQTGLVVFHGPMAAGDFARPNGVDVVSWQAALSQDSAWQIGPEAGLRTLKSGSAQGKFYGGCLSMLVASLGTPYEIQTAGTILFLEDIGVKPYQIDRMLLQLRLAGKLSRCARNRFRPYAAIACNREMRMNCWMRFCCACWKIFLARLRLGCVPDMYSSGILQCRLASKVNWT